VPAPPEPSAEQSAVRAERVLDVVRVLAREPRPAGIGDWLRISRRIREKRASAFR